MLSIGINYVLPRKMDILRMLCIQEYIKSDPVFLCYDTCLPVKNLNLDYLRRYFTYKKANGVYLYTYDNNTL